MDRELRSSKRQRFGPTGTDISVVHSDSTGQVADVQISDSKTYKNVPRMDSADRGEYDGRKISLEDSKDNKRQVRGILSGSQSDVADDIMHASLNLRGSSIHSARFPTDGKMVDVEAIRKAQRADGPACVLAIGTATPPNAIEQSDYPDYYFRITNSEHKVELKEKFKRMCEKSMIRKRYMYLTEEILKENPNVCAYMAPSLDARQDMVVVEVPRLGKEAAAKAIKEWGQGKSKITHLIFCTTSGVDMPGADYQLTKLLGLRPSVKRVMMYQQGCFAGGTVLRVAKDLAENNRGARVLVVCSEITAVTFRGPSDTHLDSLVGQALFGDGAAAVIVGADPVPEVEKPCFQLLWTAQTILPDSEGAIDGHLREVGLTFHLLKDVPGLISKNIEKALVEAFQQFNISNWNDLFWIAHPGGPAILDQVESKLELDPKKMRATRHILSEYGNMSSACVLFILDEMRKSSKENGHATTGEGLDMGVLFGFGPGLTVETVVLKSVPLQ